MKIIYERPYAKAVYLPESHTIYCTWLKGTTAEQYREVFLNILDSFRKYGALTYLSDIRHQGIVGTESRKWLEQAIIPEAIKAGMRNIYVITSEDAFKKFYLDKVKSEVNKQSSIVKTEYFTTEEDALMACDQASTMTRSVAV